VPGAGSGRGDAIIDLAQINRGVVIFW